MPTEMRTRSLVTPAVQLLLVAQLLVRGGCRVNDQALGVAQIGQVREDLHVVDQLAARLGAALDSEGHDRALPLRQILLRDRRSRGSIQARDTSPT